MLQRLLLASLAAALLAPLAAGQNIASNTDTFEDDVTGSTPVGNFYTTSSQMATVSNSIPAASGAKTARVTPGLIAGNSPTASAVIFTASPCVYGGSFGFKVRFVTDLGTNTNYITFDANGGIYTANALGTISITSGGVVTLPGGATTTAAADTWYSVVYSAIRCRSTTEEPSSNVNVCWDTTCSTLNTPSQSVTPNAIKFAYNAAPPSGGTYIDDLFQNNYYVEHSSTAAQVTGLTNQAGFDVNPDGTYLISRTGSPAAVVTTYNAQTGAQLGTVATTCNRIESIFMMRDTAAYLTCDGAGTVTGITYKTPQLTDHPNLQADTIDLTGVANEDTYLFIEPCANTFAASSNSGPAQTTRDSCFFVGSNTGTLYGVGWSQQQTGGTATVVNENGVTYAASAPEATAACGPIGNPGDFFVADNANDPKGYHVGNLVTLPPTGTAPPSVTASISQNFVGPTAVTNSFDIDCGSDKIIVGKAGSVHVLNRTTSATIWNRGITGTLSAVAISGDSRWVAYIAVDGLDNLAHGFVRSATNGTLRGFFSVPAGTIKELDFSYSGQFVWTATTTSWHKAVVYEATTGVPVSDIPASSSSSSSTGPVVTPPALSTGNPIGNMMNFVNSAWGFDWGPIIGVIILILVVVPIAILTNGNPLAVGVAIFGVDYINIHIGFWPTWTLFVMVFLVIAVTVHSLTKSKETQAA